MSDLKSTASFTSVGTLQLILDANMGASLQDRTVRHSQSSNHVTQTARGASLQDRTVHYLQDGTVRHSQSSNPVIQTARGASLQDRTVRHSQSSNQCLASALFCQTSFCWCPVQQSGAVCWRMMCSQLENCNT